MLHLYLSISVVCYMNGGYMFELLQLDDTSFLKSVLKKYPEIQYTIQGNKTTASAGQAQSSGSLTAAVFETDSLYDHVEYERAAVALLCLKYVLTNDYNQFIACQNPHSKLSLKSFESLRNFTLNIIQSSDDLETAIYMIMCNDLGKTYMMREAYQDLTKNLDADHDAILATLLNKKPELFVGFQNLSDIQKSIIHEGLNTAFNLGQFAQCENTPADLPKIQAITKKARDLYILHAFYDIAGAAGHIKNNGSLVMSEPVYCGYDLAIKSLMTEPFSNSYNHYVHIRGNLVGFDSHTKKGFALSRLAALSRCFQISDGDLLQEVFDNLPDNVQQILQKELNETGLSYTPAILIYYAPAFIDNIKKHYLGRLPATADNIVKKQNLYKAYQKAFTALAQIYNATRIAVRKQNLTGVITIDINDLAKQVLQNADVLDDNLIDIQVNLDKKFGSAYLKGATQINTHQFIQNKSICDILPQGKTAYIGIGGGSDCVQAGQIAFFNPDAAACIISVRTQKTQSQGKHTKEVGVNREIMNHGGEIVSGVYKVLPETTASGRFMENLVAGTTIPVYVVLDKQDGLLGQKIRAAIQHAGGADNIISVDTGGDSLYLSTTDSLNSAKATPDQDYASLKAISELDGYNKISVIMATGVDTPSYAQFVLAKSEAVFIAFSDKEKNQLLENYHQWGMDGTSDAAFGKTPLALQSALNNKTGISVLPLPSSVVLDDNNPWNPFVIVTDSMRYIAVMPLENHFNIITNNTEKTLIQSTIVSHNENTVVQNIVLQETQLSNVRQN